MDNVSDLLVIVMGLKNALMAVMRLDALHRALLASFAVTMVSVFPLLSGAMDLLVDVVMAVMREDALHRALLASFAVIMVSALPPPSVAME